MKRYDVQPDNGGWSILWYAPTGAWRDGRNFASEQEAVEAAEAYLSPCSCGHADHSAYCCDGRDSDGVPCDCAGAIHV